MATAKPTPSVVKLVAAIAAIVVGVFLIFFPSTPALADGIFVAALALAAALFLWSGVTTAQARTVAIVLMVLAAYALIRGFGLLELTLLRQLGGILAIACGAVLAWPAIRGKLGK